MVHQKDSMHNSSEAEIIDAVQGQKMNPYTLNLCPMMMEFPIVKNKLIIIK